MALKMGPVYFPSYHIKDSDILTFFVLALARIEFVVLSKQNVVG